MINFPFTVELAGLSVPAIPPFAWQACAEHAIELTRDGLEDLHWPLSEAGWITCQAAWPHQDLAYAGTQFLTLALEADHEYCEITEGRVIAHGVRPGTVFTTEPLRLHWLRPHSPDSCVGFIGLQWEIDGAEFDEKSRMILAALNVAMPLAAAATTVTLLGSTTAP